MSPPASTNDLTYLRHIRECIGLIEDWTKGGKAMFLAGVQQQDAVVRRLQTLSESTQRLSTSIKNQHEEIPWRQIAEFRNVVVHNYLGLDLEQVWLIVERDLPPLKVVVDNLIRHLSPSGM